MSHAPSSFINHPTEMLETAGAAALPFAAFAAPALAGAAGGLFGGAADALGGFFGGAADAAGGLFGGADAALPEGSTLASFTGDTASTTAAGGDGFGSFYTDVGLNPNMTDPNAFSAGNQLAGVTPGSPGGVSPGADASASLQSLTTGTDPTAADPLTGNAAGQPVDAVSGTGGKGAADAGGQSFYDKLVSGVKNAPGAAVDQIAKNPLGVGLGVGALGYTMMQNQKTQPNVANLENQANTLTAQGQQFMQFLQNGTLPPALKASVDQAANAAKARIIANHAANGQSTDPTQNSALAQELAAADQNALIAVGQLGEQLFTAGQSEVGLSSQIYEKLVAIDQQQSANTGKAIANFASALGTGAKAA